MKLRPGYSLLIVLALASCFSLSSCRSVNHQDQYQYQYRKDVSISGKIISMEKDGFASFRYHGEVRCREPAALRGKAIWLYIISFESDPVETIGASLEVVLPKEEATHYLHPIDSFGAPSNDQVIPVHYEENEGYRFREFNNCLDRLNFSGTISEYVPESEGGVPYIYDFGFCGEIVSGDEISVILETPDRYKGHKITILRQNYEPNKVPLPGVSLNRGDTLRFSTFERNVLTSWIGIIEFGVLGDITN